MKNDIGKLFSFIIHYSLFSTARRCGYYLLFAICYSLFAVPRLFAQANISTGIEVIEINFDDDIDDDGFEWLKLQNRTGRSIDISGWRVVGKTLSQAPGWGDIKNIPQGATFVISEPAVGLNNFATRYGSFKNTNNYLAIASGNLSLSNTGGRITISSMTSGDIQDFNYYPVEENYSVVKISFDADETLRSSWRIGTPGGTPFEVGAVSTAPATILLTIDENTNPFNPHVYQSVAINFESDSSAVKNLYIIDVTGKEVVRLVSNDITFYGASLAGINKAILYWNGKNFAGEIVPVGIYVVCFETVDTNKKINRLKRVVVVGRQF